MRDQAERLRQIADKFRSEAGESRGRAPRRARVLAVTSGKGGVGKTNVSVNLSYALMALGQEVMVLDADLGLANVDVLLGTVPQQHLGHALTGQADILDVIYEGPGRLKLIAGGSGMGDLADLQEADLQRFIQSLRKLENRADYLVIDTGAGLGRSVRNFVLSADMVLVVTTPEPTAMTDAYALIKSVVQKNPAADIKLIVNQVESKAEAEEAASRLRTAMLRFLGASTEYLGAIPVDREVPKCVRNQQPFFLAAPNSAASQAVRSIASRLLGDPENPPAGVTLFFDRLSRVFAKWR
ncbi:MAG TPA: MinD/ParA family protein [Symbiobacteriaceae bacterium]|jgi:flagellar biosynthesis protein FlhG|nr:MinD/ParA family protein [Symbiobacteriaceae bacterium]